MPAKDTIFLHIGMHKTATTSIQKSLRTYSDGTTRYARLGAFNHSWLLISVFSTSKSTKRHLRRKGVDYSPSALSAYRAANFARLETQINTRERNLILSGEGLAALIPSEVADLRAFLDARSEKTHLIAYIRDPVSFASSGFQQRIRSGERKFHIPSPDYRRRFASYVDVFGAEAIEFIRFAPDTFPDHCIITDFCARTGIDASRVDKTRTNESLSNETIALLLFWNREGVKSVGSPAHLAARKQIITLLQQQFPGKFQFDPARVMASLDQDDCRWMEHLAGFSLLPSPSDQPPKTTGIASEQQLRDLCLTAMPGLRALLAERDLPVGGRVSTVLMNRLYTSLLNGTQTE